MDTSKEYIKMCEKAVEIQALCQYREGDWYVDKKGVVGAIEADLEDGYCGDHWQTREGLVAEYNEWGERWLPRQDQLQEMVDWSSEDANGFVIPNLISREYRFCMWIQHEIKTHIPEGFYGQAVSITSGADGMNRAYTSFEQLWMAFVMKEKFGKIWDGGDWIEAE